uniref:Metaxin-1 n=1 Tax=Nothoprocta perdicaria TaxID=30464 RepID=A0A8C6YQW5_NOTPE
MAAPMELFCWAGGWGLPSVDPDCLAVLTYARFTGAPLKVHRLANPWRSPSGKDLRPGSVPDRAPVPFAPQKYNADYDLSAQQGADTLAFVSLLEEKLLPVLIHTFWVDAKNYVEHTRKWYAETIPFPLNFFLPNCMHKRHLERLQLRRAGDGAVAPWQLYRDARECLTLLSQRLGSQKFFFGDSPASLDALVFSRLAPLLKAKLPNGKLQQHLKSLQNLCNHCAAILSLYFPWDGGDALHGDGDTDGSPRATRGCPVPSVGMGTRMGPPVPPVAAQCPPWGWGCGWDPPAPPAATPLPGGARRLRSASPELPVPARLAVPLAWPSSPGAPGRSGPHRG